MKTAAVHAPEIFDEFAVIDRSSQEKFEPRIVKWCSKTLLQGITDHHITATPEHRHAVHHDLWGDMCAENDAENLWAELHRLNLPYTEEFLKALEAWRLDEQNHFTGLRQICSTLYHVPEKNIDAQMKERKPDFHNLRHFLKDEFNICVVLAYDELVSARGYIMFMEDFEKFGPKPYVQWVKWAARDEALHYQNFIEIVRMKHAHRIPEAADIIQEITRYEEQKEYVYHATFLLDHTEETFQREFLRSCGKMVLDALTRDIL